MSVWIRHNIISVLGCFSNITNKSKIIGKNLLADKIKAFLYIFILNYSLNNIKLREHQQKTFITLSRFWLLRRWGV